MINLGIIFPSVHPLFAMIALSGKIFDGRKAAMSERIFRENLMVLAQAYADANNWSLSTVSKQIHGNQAFLARYANGEISTTIKTYYAMVDRLRTNWPPETPWPITAPVPELGKNIDK